MVHPLWSVPSCINALTIATSLCAVGRAGPKGVTQSQTEGSEQASNSAQSPGGPAESNPAGEERCKGAEKEGSCRAEGVYQAV